MSVLISRNFTTTGQSDVNSVKGDFNVEVVITGSGSVDLERQLEGGSSYVPVETFDANTSKVGFEPAYGTKYRFNCTAVSGSVACRITK